MNARSPLLIAVLALLAPWLAGAQAGPAPANPAAPDMPIPPAVKQELDKIAPPTIVTAKPADGTTLTVNAMIGQVNGRPLYASTVLEPLEGQLRAWGSTLSQREFRAGASKLVGDRLYQIVFDSLYLGEAERHLTEQERFGLKINLRLNREELVRRFGAGSEPKADEEMRKKTGKGLEETLSNIRQTILVRKYQDEVILPKIIVSRRDIERYYFDPANFERFNPKPGRKIRQIRTTSEIAADQIDKQLAAGKPFTEVAADSLNQFNRAGGGLMTAGKDAKGNDIEFIQGDKVFGPQTMNDALLKLTAGQHSPRITERGSHYWIFLEAMSEGKQVPLKDAQLQIEQQLKGMQYQVIEQRYRKKLFEDAGYTLDSSINNPLAEMNRALVDIATNVYGGAPK